MTPSHLAFVSSIFTLLYCEPLTSMELLSKHIVMTAPKQRTIAIKSPLLIGFLRKMKAARLIMKGLV